MPGSSLDRTPEHGFEFSLHVFQRLRAAGSAAHGDGALDRGDAQRTEPARAPRRLFASKCRCQDGFPVLERLVGQRAQPLASPFRVRTDVFIDDHRLHGHGQHRAAGFET